MTEWTTRTLPEYTRRYGIEEMHGVYFAPKGWSGKGATVSLAIPECELLFGDLGPDGRPFAMVNRPKVNRSIRLWTRTACKIAVKQQALMTFHCDTAAQAEMVAKRAARLLPNYTRLAQERMYLAATRCGQALMTATNEQAYHPPDRDPDRARLDRPLDPDPDPERKVPRRQRYKKRQAAGRICLSVVVDEDALAAALPRSGRLTPEQALDRRKLAKAVADIVADFIERWGGRVPCDGSGSEIE